MQDRMYNYTVGAMFNNPYSKHYYEVQNPCAPFDGDIPHGVKPGKQIFVSGHLHPHTDNFSFNLVTNTGSIAFCVNPRFSQNCIVRNTERGGWGPEERGGPVPFQRGSHFEIIISVEEHCYRVAINGHHAFDYNHRIPYQEVTRFRIVGEFTVYKIIYSGGNKGKDEQFNLNTPYIAPIHGGCKSGRMIQIYATPSESCNRFGVYMQGGSGTDEQNVQFVFNPRFDDPYTGQAVIRTNRRHGGWGAEERDVSHFPFQKGQQFELLILSTEDEWKVAVNGQHYISFKHRSPLYEASHLYINGELNIHSVRQF